VSESEWGELRRQLCTQFPEDIVQTVLLKLWEFYLGGGTMPADEAIYWCRSVAYRLKINGIEHEQVVEAATTAPILVKYSAPEQELVFLETEVFDRLDHPQDRSGQPLRSGRKSELSELNLHRLGLSCPYNLEGLGGPFLRFSELLTFDYDAKFLSFEILGPNDGHSCIGPTNNIR
jgi:hypothetical protein